MGHAFKFKKLKKDDHKEYVVKINTDLKDYLSRFIKNRLQDILNIKELIKQKKINEISEQAHIMAGITGSFGYMRLYRLSLKIEQAANNKEIEKIKDLLDEYEFFINKHKVEFV